MFYRQFIGNLSAIHRQNKRIFGIEIIVQPLSNPGFIIVGRILPEDNEVEKTLSQMDAATQRAPQ
ncbi:MAG: hypothetical protein QME42_02445 [bacterium]|nr:hypothetical protein [bacterium]